MKRQGTEFSYLGTSSWGGCGQLTYPPQTSKSCFTPQQSLRSPYASEQQNSSDSNHKILGCGQNWVHAVSFPHVMGLIRKCALSEYYLPRNWTQYRLRRGGTSKGLLSFLNSKVRIHCSVTSVLQWEVCGVYCQERFWKESGNTATH